MRRVCLALAAAATLGAAGPGRAADLAVAPHVFSPGRVKVEISGSLSLTRQVGLQLTTPGGRAIGWIVRPQRASSVTSSWNGKIAGARVPDGRYVVRLIVGSNTLAKRPVRIDTHAPELGDLTVSNGSTRFAGDSRLLTTVSPNGDGFRDSATVRFRLREPATVTLEVSRTVKTPRLISTITERLPKGVHLLHWKPPTTMNPRTYLLRLRTMDLAGNESVYGSANAFVGRALRAPVVRLQGIDAGFTRQSYIAGQRATVHVATDAPQLTLKLFQAGPEQVVTYADNQLAGIEVPGTEQTIDWSAWRNKARDIVFQVPATLRSGLYYVQFGSADGRIGYAPFVVRPIFLGSTGRVLVVLPTNTWQAYNFQDEDGDGYGDTWYAGAPHQTVDLRRTYIARGVPPRFYRYDFPFLHWLYWSGKNAEFIADSDFQTIAAGDDLAAAYDLIIFEGHEEYVGSHEYDVVERYRDLGGNLMFLSANNFFWDVTKRGQVLRRSGQWRQNGRPEVRLLGVQYRANDDGQRQGLFTVQSAATSPWLWSGTDLADGATFGQFVGGYGIEIDSTTPESPPGTQVLATIPDLFGPGVSAQMTYYETPAGAKVFAAGALDFGGSATFWPVKRMLENLWVRLSAP